MERTTILLSDNEWLLYLFTRNSLERITRLGEQIPIGLEQDDLQELYSHIYNLNWMMVRQYTIYKEEETGEIRIEFDMDAPTKSVSKFAQKLYRSQKVYDVILDFI